MQITIPEKWLITGMSLSLSKRLFASCSAAVKVFQE
jgi:hypothetical protein